MGFTFVGRFGFWGERRVVDKWRKSGDLLREREMGWIKWVEKKECGVGSGHDMVDLEAAMH